MSAKLSPVKATFLFPHTVAVGVDLVFCAASATYFVESCEHSQRKEKSSYNSMFDAVCRLTIRCGLLLWEVVQDGSAGSLWVGSGIPVLLELIFSHQVNLQFPVQSGSYRRAETMSPSYKRHSRNRTTLSST